jgi:hypothetical protein
MQFGVYMKRSLFWFLAIFITLASAVYQRLTGPTYPASGKLVFSGQTITYALQRSHDVGNQPVRIMAPDTATHGTLSYRRYKSSDAWTRCPMIRDGDELTASLPHQMAAGKLAYKIELTRGTETAVLPEQGAIITRFKGAVPSSILMPHILFMFLAMLLSTRAGLAALAREETASLYTYWTIGMLIIGGMIFGPLVQKFAFGALWTGIPFGFDLTDNKTLISLVAWLLAAWRLRHGNPARGWILAAAIITLVIFLIPHSLMGSELQIK